MTRVEPGRAVRELSLDTDSLARGLPECEPGSLVALGPRGGVVAAPAAGLDLLFGRDEPGVHVSVGEDDPRVSRRHGLLHCDGRRWTIRNTGVAPIRLPGSQLLPSGHELPLPVSYTPVFIRTEPDREHLLEIRVAGSAEPRPDAPERSPAIELTAHERLVLVALGQRYLRHEPHPQPLPWDRVAGQLAELRPDLGWTAGLAEHTVREVRSRLAGTVAGLTRDEVAERDEDTVNHNLLVELMVTTAVVPPDLWLLSRSR